MPFRSNSRAVIAIVSLLLIITALSGIALWAIIAQSTAVNDLHTSSARGECRGQVKNDADDRFQHRLADVLAAAERRDSVTVSRIVHEIQAATPVQRQIDAKCPKPLVSPTTARSK